MSSLTYQQLDQFLRNKAEKLNQQGFSIAYSSSFSNEKEKTEEVPDSYLEKLLHMGIIDEEELDELLSFEVSNRTETSCKCGEKTSQECSSEEQNCSLDKEKQTIEDFTHSLFDMLETLFGNKLIKDKSFNDSKTCCNKTKSESCNHNEKCEKDKLIQNIEDIVNIVFSTLLGKSKQDVLKSSTLSSSCCDKTKPESCDYNAKCEKDGEALLNELKDAFNGVKEEFKNEAQNLKSIFKDFGLGQLVEELESIFKDNQDQEQKQDQKLVMDKDKNFTCTGKGIDTQETTTCLKQESFKACNVRKSLDESVFDIVREFLADSLVENEEKWTFSLEEKKDKVIVKAVSQKYPLEILYKETKNGTFYVIINTERNEEIHLSINKSFSFSHDLKFLFEKQKKSLQSKANFLSFLDK